MADYSKYRAAVISKAEYDTDGVGYSTVQADFPFVLGAGVPFDTIDIKRTWGRDPADGFPLYVDETGVQRYKAEVVSNGVVSATAYATPTKDSDPAACISIVHVSAASVLAGIDGAAKHFVLGVDPKPLDDPEAELPAGLQPYAWNAPMPSARWNTLKAGMVSLDVSEAALDNWASNHPDFTPYDFAEAFKNFIS